MYTQSPSASGGFNGKSRGLCSHAYISVPLRVSVFDRERCIGPWLLAAKYPLAARAAPWARCVRSVTGLALVLCITESIGEDIFHYQTSVAGQPANPIKATSALTIKDQTVPCSALLAAVRRGKFYVCASTFGALAASCPAQRELGIGDLNLPACWPCGLTLQCHSSHQSEMSVDSSKLGQGSQVREGTLECPIWPGSW